MKASATIPMSHELLDEAEATRRAMTGTASDDELAEQLAGRAPKRLPHQQRAKTTVVKGVGPERVRKG